MSLPYEDGELIAQALAILPRRIREYPRKVIKVTLTANAASVILAHNHPSGVSEPSRADEMLIRELKAALALVHVKVLDHFLVAGGDWVPFAESGLL